MKVLQVTTGINPASGGPTRSVKGICRALDAVGVEVTLLVMSGHHEFEDRGHVRVLYGESVHVQEYDIVHIQGLWSPSLHRVSRMCRKQGVPYVISPRGMLDPWALHVKWWKKRIALWLYQYLDLRGAVAFHVTAAMEEKSVRAQRLTQPCFVVPNGVTLPLVMPPRKVNGGCKTALFLSRLHPGKGLLTLAEAWARVRPQGWIMKVVGPDSYGHKAAVIELLEKLGIREQWQFVDMLNDVEKWEAYRAADLLIHPSVSENFGITIAEGLAAGVPVVTTKGTPWGELETERCGWWVDIGVEPLLEALREAVALTDEARVEMGIRGQRLIEAKYQWPAIGRQMVKAYEEILGKDGVDAKRTLGALNRKIK